MRGSKYQLYMKRTFILLISLLLLSVYGQAQELDSGFNLDFEIVENGLPVNWYGTTSGDTVNYNFYLDSIHVKSGKYAAAMEFIGNSVNLQSISFILPNNYDGKKITLSGYIKTENITEGFAGFAMVIMHRAMNFMNEYEIISRDNEMRIAGTTDWNKYEITLDMNPANTRNIIFAGILAGNGKVWLDDFMVTVDGKDVQQLEPFIQEPFPAESDKEFDNDTHVVFPSINKQNDKDLELLGRIWGFLKYHHPAIAKGNFNWDYELFRFLPKFFNSDDHTQRDNLLLSWINQLGNIPVCDNCRPTDNAFLSPDLEWVENSNMNLELKNKLRYIYHNRHQGHQYYIMISHFNNPLFLNENEYANMAYPDAGFRLLALYRYWNLVHYFYPSKYLTDKDWNTVLGEYIPYFIEAKDELTYELTCLRLVGEICDSHAANLLGGGDKINLLKGSQFAPFKAGFIENKLVVTNYYTLRDTVLTVDELKRQTGLIAGDIITHINGKSVESIIDSMQVYYPASNEATRMSNMVFDLLRSNQQTINVNYITSGQVKQTDIELFSFQYIDMYKQDTSKCYRLLNKGLDIGYINLELLQDEDVPNVKRELMHTKGIILDLRSRPPLAGQLLGPWFVSSDTVFVKYTKGNPDNPGEFVFTRRETDFIQKAEETYRGKVVVLVNEKTQSEGEYQAMMFRAGQHTTIIGGQTAGADGRVSEISLPGGIKTWISGLAVYYPDGTQTQRIGIVPDIEIHPTIQGIRDGRDELLEKAIEFILQE